jgi:hypothetical protein
MQLKNRVKVLVTMTILLATSVQAKSESSFATEAQTHESIEQFIDIVNNDNEFFEFPINGVEVHERCNKFMNANLTLGPLGQYINNEVQSNAKKYPYLLGSSQMKSLCPKYSKMNMSEKAFVWTLVMTTMAHLESNCNIKASTKGPNGETSGFYQLHNGKEDFYDGDKSECFKFAGADPQSSSRCALAMLDLQMKNNDGLLFTKKSYWDVLRPSGVASSLAKAPQKINKAITNHRACQ